MSSKTKAKVKTKTKTKHNVTATTNTNTTVTGIDLSIIDEAFGKFADLYSDVLRVNASATPDQIQLAYFDRRSELFSILAKLESQGVAGTGAGAGASATSTEEEMLHGNNEISIERHQTERKMDSVVLAVRILGDTDQRVAYDQIRTSRLLNRRRAKQGQLPGYDEPDNNNMVTVGLDTTKNFMVGETTDDENSYPRGKSQKQQQQRNEKSNHGKNRKTRKSEASYGDNPASSSRSERTMSDARDTRDARQEDDTDGDGDMTIDTTTVYTYDSRVDEKAQKKSYMSCLSGSRFVKKISDEISGACEDTLISMDQVCNAFTLTDKDIKAVTRRIDKAKRQLDV